MNPSSDTPLADTPLADTPLTDIGNVYLHCAQHALGITVPSLDEFRQLCTTRRVVPVVRRLLADGETPVGLYRKLTQDRPGTYLLESLEHGRVWSRYSFIGVRSVAMLTEHGGNARWIGSPPPGVVSDGGSLDAMRDTLTALHTQRLPGLPPFTSGLVGMISYDAVRHWERLPQLTPDELELPEIAMLLASDLAVLDHADGSVLLIANAFIDPAASQQTNDDAYRDATAALDDMAANLATPSPPTSSSYDTSAVPEFTSRTGRDDYLAGVAAAREHIFAGDAFQIVLSQRFEMPTTADALDIYRVLRVSNPSPYMYLFRFPSANSVSSGAGGGADAAPHGGLGDAVAFEVVGSSPEALVTLHNGRALLHPIAGTRRRGATAAEDAALGVELLADEKDRAEHLMLVDLGRNDLGRVSAPGTVEVVQFMEIERYSHVMHIVSTVVGELAAGKSAYDLLAATFPAGTLSGAPKPRAMEIIEELEPSRRGLYGGCVGYLDFAGDMDTAIAIRTAVLRDGVAYVQAGAGLVADSDPIAEETECRTKAAAVLRAIATAATLRPLAGGGVTEDGGGATK